jgi:CubicO group peptidase (beta-lactamase class C family)
LYQDEKWMIRFDLARQRRLVLGVVVLAVSAALIFAAVQAPKPANEDVRVPSAGIKPSIHWRATKPEVVGLKSGALDELIGKLAGAETSAFLLAKDGLLVREWYADGVDANTPLSVASLAKALVGSILLAVALDVDAAELNDAAGVFIPEWNDQTLKSTVTLRQLANHTAGFEEGYWGRDGPTSAWHEDFHQDREARFELAIQEAPLRFPPGSRVHYSGVGYYALAYAIAAALADRGYLDGADLLRRRVMLPLGVPDDSWDISYGESYRSSGLRLYAIGSGARFTARAVGRLGELVLLEGNWRGRQLIRRESVLAITRPEPSVNGRGRPSGGNKSSPTPVATVGWWSNANGAWPSLPSDSIVGLGANHQVLLIVPSSNLVVVRLGAALGGSHWGPGYWRELEESFMTPVSRAVGLGPARRTISKR